jgi:hypothetical protein
MSSTTANKTKSEVIKIPDWNVANHRFMQPKTNKSGGKSITIISNQSGRALKLATPLMMTWGISDFTNEEGVSDNKFQISLNFPNPEYTNPQTDEFLAKMKEFENQILDDAVKNSEIWWGEPMTREILKHTFFPILKYQKMKDSKKIDLSKPPSMRAKAPYYDGKWDIEIFNVHGDLIFPIENSTADPPGLVPKLSHVAGVIQCTGIWIGGKGCGLTWKMLQCVVQPKETISMKGR